jgi:copper(I)-binding protein
MLRFKRLRRAAVVALTVLSSTVPVPQAAAHDYRVGDLQIMHPWSRATPPSARVGAGYLSIVNGGSAADRLVSASSPVAGRVEIHEMRLQDGVMRMRERAGGLALPAGETVALRPGGYHVMLMDLRAPLAQGTRVPLRLVFERAGAVEVELQIEAPTARGSDHGHGHGHGHGGHGIGHGGSAPAAPPRP